MTATRPGIARIVPGARGPTGAPLLLVRRDRELAVYSLVALALPQLPSGALGSMPRDALVAFPALAMLAGRLGNRWGWGLVAVFALAQVVFAGRVFAGGLHP